MACQLPFHHPWVQPAVVVLACPSLLRMRCVFFLVAAAACAFGQDPPMREGETVPQDFFQQKNGKHLTDEQRRDREKGLEQAARARRDKEHMDGTKERKAPIKIDAKERKPRPKPPVEGVMARLGVHACMHISEGKSCESFQPTGHMKDMVYDHASQFHEGDSAKANKAVCEQVARILGYADYPQKEDGEKGDKHCHKILDAKSGHNGKKTHHKFEHYMKHGKEEL